MVELTIDGHTVEVPEGSMVMHAIEKRAQYVPHFCYHKKLSIAANCRMCLVEIEKAPKPMPACATPVSQGMVVHTASEKAVNAQKGVMEFLLINHPLDCPICDQGGECQLQDLAVGYGASESKYQEEKRVVFHKNLGPLISAEEMSRCIHCTRCVRFGQEVAGVMELGMLNRGEHAEITSFLGRTVDSELSGNMIDICPVGALTSKPFRYSARTWELSRRKSISPHDSLGTNLSMQVKNNKVMRVVPLENEEINECWISDRDRFSYEGLNSPDRLTQPMIKLNGQWQATDWENALTAVVQGLNRVKAEHGADAVGGLFSANSTIEEIFLLNKLVRKFDSDKVDFRLRMQDFSADTHRRGVPWLGMPIHDLSTLDRILIIGSFLRKDHPLLAARIRQAVKRGAKVSVVHCSDDDLLMPVSAKSIVKPSQLPAALAKIAVALARHKDVAVPEAFARIEPSESDFFMAKSMASGANGAIFLGNFAVNHPAFSELQATAQWIAQILGAKLGFFGEAANTVGAYALGAYSTKGFVGDSKALVLMNVEPRLDCADAGAAVRQAEFVVALTAFASAVADDAQVMLPITPFSETDGSFINTEGRLQSFNAVVQPLGESRPAWKVLRVMAEQANLQGFEFDSAQAIRTVAVEELGSWMARLDNAVSNTLVSPASEAEGLERVADVPIYFADSIVRRADSLQQTADAKPPGAHLNPSTLAEQGYSAGCTVKLNSACGSAQLELYADNTVPLGAIRIATAHPLTANLGAAPIISLEAV
ncbi:MAG: NADH-quinone oxidoreductase subunit NuoG [Burkholderiaceae bacterium]|nr:NADH-quinone oxidoreductase subunit NuoG [Burkholderiaceae bacterium]